MAQQISCQSDMRQGCLWGGPPARQIDLRTRPIRVKHALTDYPQ
jgi:hypothetical protein